MAEYRFITQWYIEAPLHEVFDAILDSLHWPQWWHGVERVEERETGDSNGIGSIRRYTWKSRLLYRLTFDARATRIERHVTLEAIASGDLEGVGRCLFSCHGYMTIVRYEWHVRTTKLWMNLLAPIARFLFKKNHNALMQSGAEGLARLLGARLVAVSHVDAPVMLGRRYDTTDSYGHTYADAGMSSSSTSKIRSAKSLDG